MIPAVGYRFWRVDPDDAWTRGRLQSPVAETLWPPLDRLNAECQTRPGLRLARAGLHRHDEERTSPEPACSCGIYAYHDIAPMTRALREEPYMFGGAVLCWGRIVIHPEGLRAQHARPLALCRPESPLSRARRQRPPCSGPWPGRRPFRPWSPASSVSTQPRYPSGLRHLSDALRRAAPA